MPTFGRTWTSNEPMRTAPTLPVGRIRHQPPPSGRSSTSPVVLNALAWSSSSGRRRPVGGFRGWPVGRGGRAASRSRLRRFTGIVVRRPADGRGDPGADGREPKSVADLGAGQPAVVVLLQQRQEVVAPDAVKRGLA